MPDSKPAVSQTLGSGRITWKEVAELAGVSQSAVSRTFTAGASVSPKTRAKMEAAAKTLGYRPTVLPSILRGGESSIVAVVVGGFYNPFFASALDLIVERLASEGKQTMLVKTDNDTSFDHLVEDLSRYRVDAVVSALSIASEETARSLSAYRIPIVALNSDHSGGWLRTISSGNRSAGQHAHRLLTERGRSKLAYFSGTGSTPDRGREEGFIAAGIECGQEIELVPGGFDYHAGRAAAVSRFTKGAIPDGIFCVNDLVACGVLDALRYDFGVRVPEEVSVIGYDNIPMSEWAPYMLTTFDQDLSKITEMALQLMKPDTDVTSITVEPRLVQRLTL
ncbi:LacI family DNA-binding transcriptional regulator [Pseudomonas savastanoi]|uniref:LacI family DNA-binding transcriptional regulator n=1 Tax=Pseudomonas savastanoi TaxID=29438 RepID=UPI000EFDC40F|nr:LacI family DNA-binding transcriptional regulator [Pseudomonas savastanoi]RML92454.1 hypothetical protein ALQ87_02054 [Pseudomonas savastanoi pv. glycinea]